MTTNAFKKVQYRYHGKNGVFSDHTECTYLLNKKLLYPNQTLYTYHHSSVSMDRKAIFSAIKAPIHVISGTAPCPWLGGVAK